jgi:hypothetical protein
MNGSDLVKARDGELKARNDARARDLVLEEIAAHWDGLGVMRKMWSAAQVAESIRGMKSDLAPIPAELAGFGVAENRPEDPPPLAIADKQA